MTNHNQKEIVFLDTHISFLATNKNKEVAAGRTILFRPGHVELNCYNKAKQYLSLFIHEAQEISDGKKQQNMCPVEFNFVFYPQN